MRFPSLALLLIGVGCSQSDPSDLRVVEGTQAEPEVWQPGAETTERPEYAADCQAADSTLDFDSLEAVWCLRVSPEEDDDAGEPELDAGCAADPGRDDDPWRCGFENLLGDVAVRPSADGATVLYCDSDEDGGTRFAELHPESLGFERRLLHPRECRGAPQDGGFLELDALDGYLASMVSWDGASNRAYVYDFQPLLHTVSPSRLVDAIDKVVRALPIGGGPAGGLLVRTEDRELHHVALGSDGSVGASALLSTDIDVFSTAPHGDGTAIAACTSADSVRVILLDATGAIVHLGDLADSECGHLGWPAPASDGEAVAIAWDDEVDGWLAVLDADHDEVARIELGAEAIFPIPVFDGDGFVVADGRGAVLTVSVDGVPGASWSHPYLPSPSGKIMGIRLQVDGDLLLAAFASQHTAIVGTHAYTTQFLDVAAVVRPPQ